MSPKGDQESWEAEITGHHIPIWAEEDHKADEAFGLDLVAVSFRGIQ